MQAWHHCLLSYFLSKGNLYDKFYFLVARGDSLEIGLEIHCEGRGCFGTLYPPATFSQCLIISAPLFPQVMSNQHLLPSPSAALMTTGTLSKDTVNLGTRK